MWISSLTGKQFITSNTSSKLSVQAVVSSRNWRNMNKSCSEVRRKKWVKWWTAPLPPAPPPLPPPALYQKKNGVSALYFLLWETSDGWVDGLILLMKTCVVRCRRGPCTALGCHGNRCTCWIFSFFPGFDHALIDTSERLRGNVSCLR